MASVNVGQGRFLLKGKEHDFKLCGRFCTLSLVEELFCIDLSAFKYTILQRMFSFIYINIFIYVYLNPQPSE